MSHSEQAWDDPPQRTYGKIGELDYELGKRIVEWNTHPLHIKTQQ